LERGDEITERLESIDYDIERIDDKVSDDDVPARLLKSFARIAHSNIYKGLNTFQACYLVYNRHSEIKDLMQWKTPNDIENYLSEFKQHSLRNPIVEQVVTETLRVVKDIWEYYGEGIENYFDEIHLELGREMKNPANKRKEISSKIAENENTNHRIRELLKELKNDESVSGEIRPYSPSHQEILKIYEEGLYQSPRAKQSQISIDEIDKIRKSNAPTKNEIMRYKLWLEQGYLSPYTGKVIPLSKLFTTKYQIEHIIPQSRYFDDSLSNKIICESEVNSLKDNRTAYQFLKDERGRIVELSGGESLKLFTPEEYEEHCNDFFSGNRVKLKKLLSKDIPEGFIERQLNDSRYISKLVKGLLSNILRDENEQDAISKNLVPVTGSITSVLRHDWGLNDKWNELVAPRFKRLNEITNSNDYGYWDEKIRTFRTSVPDSILKGFNKKRIDHRHHALDALVVACTTKDHVNYITSLNTQRKNFSLVQKLRKTEKREIIDKETGEIKHRTIARNYHLPWSSFPVEAYNQLSKAIVSFKQNIRVINKANNKIWKWVKSNGEMKKEMVPQTKGDSWAIRKPMHKQTVSGCVKVRFRKEVSFNNGLKDWKNLVDKQLKLLVKRHLNEGKTIKEITKLFKDKPYEVDGKPVSKVEVYTYTDGATASRIALTEKFTRKQLDAVTDSGIQKILNKHVSQYLDEKGKERFDLAFSDEGLKKLNENIVELNNGKNHYPIYKVRVYEVGKKFPVGEIGNKSKKYVEAEKGTNLFFAVYWNEEKNKREYETIPFNEVIEHQKWRATLSAKQKETEPLIPINKNKGELLFYLSPNDLVYVPDEDELIASGNVSIDELSEKRAERIYKMVSTTQDKLECVPHNYAKEIVKNEMGANNKSQNTIDDNIQIKSVCLKLETDRLGNIIGVMQ
jgi:CRISPR-associated endonuclease Csn1